MSTIPRGSEPWKAWSPGWEVASSRSPGARSGFSARNWTLDRRREFVSWADLPHWRMFVRARRSEPVTTARRAAAWLGPSILSYRRSSAGRYRRPATRADPTGIGEDASGPYQARVGPARPGP